MSEINKKIWNICEQVVTDRGYLLIDLTLRGNDRQRIIEVFVDGKDSVDTQLCADISREIDEIIEAQDLFSNYRLDVSSPGISRPLKFIEQYPKNINRKFKVKYFENEEKKKFEGLLTNVNGEELTFSVGKQEILIKHPDIIKAQVLISF